MSKDLIRQYPDNFNICSSSVLLPNTTFRFDVLCNRDVRVIIGEDCLLNCQFIFESSEGQISIGDRTFINGGTKLISRSKISIGNDVTIAWGCYIYDHDSHSLDWKERAKDIQQQIKDYKETGNMILNKDWSSVNSKPIIIQDKVWIGFESVILKGVTIGEGAIVGARSVVTKDVEPWTIVAGNPARIVRKIDHE
ncbi:acyltransferase [Bacillus salitolerans]|uniref:Acyltransferase n=1 Tax=Bacillus salitolerans TaxID=1437434 RepID=A0ABW4LRL8_9BACI